MSPRGIGVSAFVASIVLLFLSVVLGTWYTIDEGERGVLLRNGAVSGIAEPGLGFKVPFIDDVVHLSIQSRIVSWDNVETYSKDQQLAHMRVSVNYRLAADRMREIYANYGSEEAIVSRLIQPRVFQDLKIIFGKFNAVAAIQERDRLNADVQKIIAEAVKGPVQVESVQIEDIAFSETYENSIEQRMLAEVEVLKLRQNAEREKVQAEIVVTQAQAGADRVRVNAQAEADRVRLAGDAEAYATEAKATASAFRIEAERLAQAKGIMAENEARLFALKSDPLILEYLKYTIWNGQLPTMMIPGSTVPFLNLQTH